MWRLTLAIGSAGLIAACSSVDTEAPPKLPASVVVALDPTTVAIGETSRASAVIRDQTGDILPDQPMIWQSSDPTTATVSQDGVVTAVLSGNVSIIANTGAVRGTAQLSVTRPPTVPVATLDLTVALPALIATWSTRATAVVRDAAGTVLQREIRWTSSDVSVATVDGGGVIRVLGSGSTTISAESEGVQRQVAVTIPVARHIMNISVPVLARIGRTYTLNATARYADLSASPAAVRWSLVDPTSATLTTSFQYGRTWYGFTSRAHGPIGLVATTDSASVSVVVQSYGWATTVTATGVEAELLSDPAFSWPGEGNYRGKVIVGCDNGAPYVRLATHGPALTGRVVGIDQWDKQGQQPATQWIGSGAVVTQPSMTTAAFRALITDMETGATVARVATSGGERIYLFFSEGVRTAMAAAWASCPVFAP